MLVGQAELGLNPNDVQIAIGEVPYGASGQMPATDE